MAVLKSPNKWKKRNSWKQIFLTTKSKNFNCNSLQKNIIYDSKSIKNKKLYLIVRSQSIIPTNQKYYTNSKQLLQLWGVKKQKPNTVSTTKL